MRPRSIRIVVIAALLAFTVGAQAQKPEMKAVAGASLTWTDMEVPGFNPGMKIAALVGDPSVADQAYTVRLKFPDGYRFPAHYHPKAENVTVLSGTFLLEMGPNPTGKTTTCMPGDYLFIPPTMPHSGGATGETVIQLHGMGPFEILLVKK